MIWVYVYIIVRLPNHYKMLKNNNKFKELQELLDSDDELPITYKEVPEIPVYLNDRRFDKIEFSWLKDKQPKKCPKEEISPPPILDSLETDTNKISPILDSPKKEIILRKLYRHNEGRTLLKTGILNEQDIVCMKDFAALNTDDSLLVWFIDFLIYKDLQSNFKYLKSCLVASPQNYMSVEKPNFLSCPKSINCNFEVLVK